MSLIIRKAEENDIEDFTRIKALAYADDRKKTILKKRISLNGMMENGM